MRSRKPKTPVTSALPITARAIVTFCFQQLIFASALFPGSSTLPALPCQLPRRGVSGVR